MKEPAGAKAGLFVVAFSLFIALPLFVAGYLLDSFVRQENLALDQHVTQHSRKMLGNVLGLTDVRFLIGKHFSRLRDRYFRGEIAPDHWSKIRERLKRNWGIDFDAYLYAGTGKLTLPGDMKIRSRQAFANVRKYLFHGNATFIADQAKTLKTLFGGLMTGFPGMRGRATEFRGISGSGLFFWDADPFSTEGGIVLVAWEIPSPIEVIRARLSHSAASRAITIFSRNRQGQVFPLVGSISASASSLVSQEVASSGASLAHVDGRTWISQQAGDLTFYLGQKAEKRGLELWKRPAMGLLVLLGVIGLFISHRWIIQERDPYVSIRFKLVFLFLYALSISFMGVMALANKTMRDAETILLEELKTKGETAIKELDDGFISEPERFRKIFDLFHARLNNRLAQENFSRIMNGYPWPKYFNSLELRDSGGRVIRTLGGRISSEESINALLDSAVCAALGKYLPERFKPGEPPKVSANTQIFLKALAASSETGATRIFEFPGRLTRFISPLIDVYLYGNTFPDKSLPGAFVTIALNSALLRDQYVKKELLTVRNGEHHTTKLFAVDGSCSHWLPGKGAGSQELTRFALHLRRANELVTDTITYQDRRWIAIGMPGRQLNQYSFIALLPTEPVYSALEAMKRRIGAWMGLALLITLLLGWVFSDIFLVPVTNLGMGIAALQQKNMRFRIHSSAKDELGDLSQAFNEMIGTLEEFASGKVVQEHLFPQGRFSLNSFSVFGVSRPATHLGGDYFDYLKIDDSQFLVLIGDVSGHGIPAALIMAMAKAVVGTCASSGSRPEEIFELLNKAIYSVMRGRRIMTLGLCWVRVDTPEITYFHFGQTFPMILRNGGTVEFVQAVGAPVGCRPTIRVQSQKIILEPGERILLYTDGVIESLGTSAGTDSYESFQKYVSDQAGGPLEETVRNLMERHPFFRTGEPQPDDFTLVMMERTR